MHDQRRACDRRRRRVAVPQAIAEFTEIVRDAVGEFVVRLGPDVLRRIEFGRVRWDVVNVKSGMVGQERTAAGVLIASLGAIPAKGTLCREGGPPLDRAR